MVVGVGKGWLGGGGSGDWRACLSDLWVLGRPGIIMVRGRG